MNQDWRKKINWRQVGLKGAATAKMNKEKKNNSAIIVTFNNPLEGIPSDKLNDFAKFLCKKPVIQGKEIDYLMLEAKRNALSEEFRKITVQINNLLY